MPTRIRRSSLVDTSCPFGPRDQHIVAVVTGCFEMSEHFSVGDPVFPRDARNFGYAFSIRVQ